MKTQNAKGLVILNESFKYTEKKYITSQHHTRHGSPVIDKDKVAAMLDKKLLTPVLDQEGKETKRNSTSVNKFRRLQSPTSNMSF